MSFYVFVGAPPGPDPRRAPGGPRGGPRGVLDPRRAPGGPRGGPRAQGRAQGSARGGHVSGRLKCDFVIIINASIICVYNIIYNMHL